MRKLIITAPAGVALVLVLLLGTRAAAADGNTTATGVSRQFNPAISVNTLLLGRAADQVTDAAYNGTAQAHADGGVPNMTLRFDEIAPGPVGELLYFFEHAVAVSGYLLDVNPFNQPGVEAYKQEMYERLGR